MNMICMNMICMICFIVFGNDFLSVYILNLSFIIWMNIMSIVQSILIFILIPIVFIVA